MRRLQLPSPSTRLAIASPALLRPSRARKPSPRLIARAAASEKMEKEEQNKTNASSAKNNVVAVPSSTSTSSPSTSSIPLSPEAKRTVAFLRSLGTSDVVHTGGESFLSHLVGVYRLLRYQGAPEYLCLAGLAHSIYSTEGFQGFSLECTPRNRARVAEVLGSLEAEKIAHAFCCTDRGSQDEDIFRSQNEGWKEREHRWRMRVGAPLAAAPRRQGPSFVAGEGEEESSDGLIVATHEQWLDFTTLTLADWMEQVESASKRPSEFFGWGVGQAFGYRRSAFSAMAAAVGGSGAEVYRETMAREPDTLESRAYEWRGWQDKKEVV